MTELNISEYKKALSELVEILKHIPIEEKNKIPNEELKFYEENRDFKYKFIYDENLAIYEQSIMKITKMLIANIYIYYWAENKEELQQREKRLLNKIEEEKKVKYNIYDVFEKNKKRSTDNCKEMVVIKKESVIKRLINKIKRIIKLT